MELKNKTEDDMIKILNEKRESLRGFRFGINGSKVKNVKEGRNTKRDIAMILTKLAELKK